MFSGKVFRLTLRAIVAVFIMELAAKGGADLLWLLLLPILAWDTYRIIVPRPSVVTAAKFTEPGEYRVVLQLPGPKKTHVIKELRVTTALDLAGAKKIVDDAPAVVVEGLSQESAELVADRLRAAGARALAAPIGEM